MRALVTGGTGFLGAIVARHLARSGYDVDTLGRSAQSDVPCDLSREVPRLDGRYDLVVHAAGKAHVVPRTEAQRQAFFDVNAAGTERLLEGLSRLPGAFVLISTVAVYGLERGEAIAETAPLAAADPYGRSKILAEQAVARWAEAHGVRTAVLRLPLIAGPDPPGNLGAMLAALRRGRYLGIGGGGARRSVVLASDVAAVVERAGQTGGTYNLTDGAHPTFADIEAAMCRVLARRHPPHLPLGLARLGGRLGDAVLALTGMRLPLTSRTVEKMTSSLTMDDAYARDRLGWAPTPVLSVIDDWVSGSEPG
jgi:nucleoside-diphosphate-sugar epimerase